MKIKFQYRGYGEGFAEVTAAELSMLVAVISRMQNVETDSLHVEDPSLTLDGKKVKFELRVLPDHTEIKLPRLLEEQA